MDANNIIEYISPINRIIHQMDLLDKGPCNQALYRVQNHDQMLSKHICFLWTSPGWQNGGWHNVGRQHGSQ